MTYIELAEQELRAAAEVQDPLFKPRPNSGGPLILHCKTQYHLARAQVYATLATTEKT